MIESILGRGGMGCVYRALDEATNRYVALKVARHAGADVVAHFQEEGRAQASMRHPNVMPVFSMGLTQDGTPYFVMEMLYEPVELTRIVELSRTGQLAATYPRLRRWARLRDLVRVVLIPVARGIHAANSQYGLIHRDLKPSNLLIDVRTRRPYVIDFGNCIKASSPLHAGGVVGTARFLSPEQAKGQTHPRTDVWGLGAILHFAMTGKPPIRASSRLRRPEVERRVADEKHKFAEAKRAGDKRAARECLARLDRLAEIRVIEDLFLDARRGVYLPLPDDAPAGLQAVVRKAMALDLERRYATAGLLADDLEAWVRGTRIPTPSTYGRLLPGAAAVRLLREKRNLVVALVIAMVLGVAAGIASERGPAAKQDFRARDARTRLDELSSKVAAVGANAPGRGPESARMLAFRVNGILRAHERLGERIDAVEPEAARQKLRSSWKQMLPNLRLPRLSVAGSKPGDWRAHLLSLGLAADSRLGPSPRPMLPGLYRLTKRAGSGVGITCYLPLGGATVDHVIRIPDKVKPGMVWVPSTAASGPGLLVGRRLVSCGQYAEWLDSLAAAVRQERVPPIGFGRLDDADQVRLLCLPGFSNRAVRGVQPRHIVEYLAWRSRLDGTTYRVPTTDEWRRFAGEPVTRVAPIKRGQPVPVGTQLRLWIGEPLVRSRQGRRMRGEVVQSKSEAPSPWAVLGVSPSGVWIPLSSDLDRSTSLDPSQAHEAGFRLVAAPE